MSVKPGILATEIVEGVYDRSFSVRDVAQAHLKQIDRYDDLILAFEAIDRELVMSEAEFLDVQARNGAQLPLHGVPVALKDIIDVAGMPTRAAFEAYRGRIAEKDAAIVRELRRLGAVMIGKTDLTLFGGAGMAATRNPWNLEKSPAGSSTGSGAAVAARMSPIAVGTQTTGSHLRPAAYNGVVGFKPTYGWVSVEGVYPIGWTMDHLGLYGASVEDISLVFNAMRPLSGPQRAFNSPPRIAVLPEYFDMCSPDLVDHIEDVAKRLEDAGATIVRAEMPEPYEIMLNIHQVIAGAELATIHAPNMRRDPQDFIPNYLANAQVKSLIPATYVFHAQRLRRAVTAACDRFLSRFDAVLMPAAASAAVNRGEKEDRGPQLPSSLLGAPAISLPTGLNHDNLPLAVQLMSARNSDHDLLAVSEWVANAVPLIERPDLERLRAGATV